jgi:hypothetical protein
MKIEAYPTTSTLAEAAQAKAEARLLLEENGKLRERIAELEAALRDVLPYVDTCNSSHREAQAKGYAALEGKKDE